MGRLSYGGPPTRAVQSGPVSPSVQMTSTQASLSLSLSLLAYMLWLPASEQRKRGERGIDVKASRHWRNLKF